MSDDYKRYRESVELYPVGRVNPVVPISKNKRKTPEKVLPKSKDGLFSSLLEEETQPSTKTTGDGFSDFNRGRIAKEESQRRAFQQKVKDLAEQIGEKAKEKHGPDSQ